MDESVVAAMTKWPNVPAVSGWLSLDMHGHWRLKGEPVTHPGLVDFINRNYDRDDEGRWYFQNGPQRVYVSLEYTPLVLHVDSNGTLFTHTGREVKRITAALVDEEGNFLLETERGIAVVESSALPRVSEWLVDAAGDPLEDDTTTSGGVGGGAHFAWGDQRLPVQSMRRRDIPTTYGYSRDPVVSG
ncbi:MAG: DUF2946 family protein [Halofilum sp. (in: g-proteobacteria)]|nr:DUF2946 family protein [Halofilum sp. (in: g-proteobacteria)]